MYAITQDFLDAMRADRRRVDALVEVSYTDPFIDQSISVAASEQANVSYPQQTTDAVTQTTHKWASLDGSWVLDGSYHLAPAPKDLTRYQFGWWSAQLANPDGTFTSPYPSLTITHIPRPVHTLRVGGDSARREWPVDFRIDLYGPDDVLLYSETVTGNTVVEWSMTLPAPVLDVAKQVLTLTRWSHAGRQAKVLEFFTSIQETYLSEDIMEIRLLEEREASQGSLPVGNISSNEISLRLANESGKFDVTNRQSPLWGLLKPNRRIRAWLGIRGAGDLWGDGWYAPFDRDLAVARRDGAVQEPLPGSVATLRPGEGRFSGAVAVEEGTVNLKVDPSNSNHWMGDSYKTEQGILDSDFILGKATKFYRTEDDNRIQIILDGLPYGSGGIINPQIGDVYTISWTIKYVGCEVDKEETSFIIRQVERLEDGTTENHYTNAIETIWEKDNIVRYSAKIEVRGVNGSSPQYVLPIFNLLKLKNFNYETDYILVGDIQLEQKPFATSFVDGTRANGYLRYPADILNPNEGTVAMWIIPLADLETTGMSAEIFFEANAGTSNQQQIQIWEEHGRWRAGIIGTGEQGGSSVWGDIPDNFPAGVPIFVTLTWKNVNSGQANAEVKFYKNGSFLWGRTSVKIDLPQPTQLAVGSRAASSSYWANSLLDELLILPYAASEEHIAELYRETRPLYDEWVPLGTFWSLDWDSPDDTMEAIVRARDRLELLRKGTYQPGAVQQNISLYTLAEQVLQDAGLQPGEYAIDTALQYTVVPWAWLSPTSHREALRIIAEAALAVVYADRDGVVRIETMGSMPADPVLTITADDYFPPLQAPSRQDQVANEIVVATQPLRPEDQQEVYKSTTPINVPAGQTITVTARYNQPPVIEAAATLVDPPPGVSIVGATYYAWGAEVSIRNTSGSPASVTLVVTGRPLSVQGGEQVVARDPVSITENGALRYQYPDNPLVQTLQQAQAIAQALLASAKDPRRDIEVEWRGNPALELGDRVTVVGQDVHVIRQEINWAGALSARLTGRKVTA